MKKDKTMKNNILLIIATVLMILMLVVMNCQNNQIKQYKELLELVDTTKKSDTLYIEHTVIDSVPKIVQTTLIKRDTVYKSNDSIPYLLTLKKKITLTQS